MNRERPCGETVLKRPRLCTQVSVINLCSEPSSPESLMPEEQPNTFRGPMTRQLYALISLADKEHMKTKELEVESSFWHAKCDQLTEELESLKLVLAKERKLVERHRRIFQRLKLDITSATCNMCGTGLTQEDVYILNRCGAPCCRSCVERRNTECKVHSYLGAQSAHRIYNDRCVVCHNNELGSASDLLDAECGHVICRDCLRTWVEEKYGDDEEVEDDDPRLVACTLCRNSREYQSLLKRPTLRHKPVKRRLEALYPT